MLAVAAMLAALARPAVGQSPRLVAVAARALPRGAALAAEDIAAADSARTSPSALLALRSSLAGWTTRRVIAAGEPLRAPAVAPPDAIRSGQPVAVLYADGAIRIRLAGTALNAAPLGARVAVRIDARRRLEGVAVGPSTVQLR